MNITVLLLTYNQQDFIDEALESILMQSHCPVEIIISDDCSSDATFAKICSRVEIYNGPHKIILNRNKKNIGLIKHIECATLAAKGEIIIAAAGDDISRGDRIGKIFAAFNADPSCVYVHSAAIRIDRHSHHYEKIEPPSLQAFVSPHTAAAAHCLAIGATAAWRKCLISDFPPISKDVWAEDLILGFRALLCGTVKYIDEPLVYYRTDSGITSKKASLEVQHLRDLGVRRQRFFDSLSKYRILLSAKLLLLIAISNIKLTVIKRLKISKQ